MNNKDIIAIVLIGFSLTIALSPWQIYFLNPLKMKAFNLIKILLWVIPAIYGMRRVRKSKKTFRLSSQIVLGIILAYGIFCIGTEFISTPSKKGTYALLYSNPKQESETIEIVHNHGFARNWNEVKYVKKYTELGLRLEKEFNQKNLQGKWTVYEGNPFCSSIGVFTFKDGEILSE